MSESPSSDVGTRTKEYISGKHSGEQLANTHRLVFVRRRPERVRASERQREQKETRGRGQDTVKPM